MKFAHLDDNESIFFARELELVKQKSYDVVYPNLKQRSLIPVSFDGNPADEFVVYYQFDGVGMAKIVRDFANDFPGVELLGKKFQSEIQSLGSSYQYSVQEVRAAAKTGRPLQQAKANIARKAVAIKERDLAFYGDSAFNVPGWVTNANIPDVTLTNGSWVANAATPQKLVDDLNQLTNAVATNSKGTEIANTLALPLNYFTLVSSTPRSANTDLTILDFFLKANPNISSVDWVSEFTPANSNGNLARSIAIAYDRNPEKFWMEIPQEVEEFDPQPVALAFKVFVHERFGGVIMPYPLSQAKTDDLDAP